MYTCLNLLSACITRVISQQRMERQMQPLLCHVVTVPQWPVMLLCLTYISNSQST